MRGRALSQRVATMVAVLLLGTPAGAQVGLVEAGRDIFARECASCHGQSGIGYGPASWLLKQPLPDLTKLSNRSTPFPRANVRNQVTGRIRLEPSHWRSEMPYWRGTLDKELAGSGGWTEFDALLSFLEHIQSSPYRATPGVTRADVAAAGATLFRERCVECHRIKERQPSGTEYVVGIAAPDLTTLHTRYAGSMDERRIFELIARYHQPQTTAMPSWYDSLIRAGWSKALTIKNLEALAAFVDSIQER